ncbi:hypothetical protein K449DRAFT_433935 [Hypoxylon sp. EC38]|nr:hypothetical protein K449DRAFT_433935 [Hypoxylon sp. EC38]
MRFKRLIPNKAKANITQIPRLVEGLKAASHLRFFSYCGSKTDNRLVDCCAAGFFTVQKVSMKQPGDIDQADLWFSTDYRLE